MGYIITDLTRFKDSEEVCIAVIGMEDGICRRPLPYKNRDDVKELNLTPGKPFHAEMVKLTDLSGPHTEDCNFHNLEWLDLAEENVFRSILSGSAYDSVKSGFAGKVDPQTRCVGTDSFPDSSIITVRVKPEDVSFSFVEAEEKKMRVSLVDSSGDRYRRLPVADLFFYNLATEYDNRGAIQELMDYISKCEEVFFRVGLGRLHESASGKKGYWVQVNGIYTFPGYYDLMNFK
ncbi:hypothetical protein [Maridesulfovibrio bastinii]|uniref:hypothetical protein n=1 Tax=Maridesulfovibrio bastinii TaxID=47157 RepID=UPI0003F9EAAA|nr:hypothetical protein [Maridesulfovibrio bastinii]